MISFAALKKADINIEVTQLDEKIFVTFKTIGNGQLESIQKRQKNCCKIVKLARPFGKKNPNVSEYTAQNIFQSKISLWA